MNTVTCSYCGKTYNPDTEKHESTFSTEAPNGKWLGCSTEKLSIVDKYYGCLDEMISDLNNLTDKDFDIGR
jgi:hypothetical protein